jgi:hypothetical protein
LHDVAFEQAAHPSEHSWQADPERKYGSMQLRHAVVLHDWQLLVIFEQAKHDPEEA